MNKAGKNIIIEDEWYRIKKVFNDGTFLAVDEEGDEYEFNKDRTHV